MHFGLFVLWQGATPSPAPLPSAVEGPAREIDAMFLLLLSVCCRFKKSRSHGALGKLLPLFPNQPCVSGMFWACPGLVHFNGGLWGSASYSGDMIGIP